MSELTKKIRSAGYFSVSISPTTFIAERIDKVTALLPLIEKCQVQLKGWSYPQIDHRVLIVPDRPDSISHEIEAGNKLEAWRFFQSGQFTDLRAFTSDWFAQRRGGRDWEQGELLFVEHVLFAFAEAFEFAARLSQTPAGDETIAIEIITSGLKDRRLAIADPRRSDLFGYPTARVQEFPQRFRVARSELLADPTDLTVRATQSLFGMFGKEPKAELLRDWLQELVRS